jgi:hypothetical protein
MARKGEWKQYDRLRFGRNTRSSTCAAANKASYVIVSVSHADVRLPFGPHPTRSSRVAIRQVLGSALSARMSNALRIPPADNRSQYVTLGDADSPPPGAQYDVHFPSYSDDSEAEDAVVRQEHRTWWQRFRHRGGPPAASERPQSGYLTLIPLSGLCRKSCTP